MLPPPTTRSKNVIVIAKANFQPPFDDVAGSSSTCSLYLPLCIGDKLSVISKKDDWYFGTYESNPDSIYGIFPVNYVEEFDTNMINNCMMHKRESIQDFDFEEETRNLSIEITETLKSWWKHLKLNYAKGVDNKTLNQPKGYEFYEKEMKELMLIRKKLLEGNILTEELRELRQVVAKSIDMNNHWLGLGMHIRDEKSRILMVDRISVVQAYREHERAHSRIIKNGSNTLEPKTTALVLNLANTDFKLHFDCEITLCLWNSGLSKAITEQITFKWSASTRKFKHENLNCMFIGLTEKELMDERLEIAASVAVIAPIDIAILSRNGKYTLPNYFPHAQRYKQRLAVGGENVAEKLYGISDKEKSEFRLSLKAEKELNKYQRTNDKVELFLLVSLQKLKGSSLSDIEIRHPEVFADSIPFNLRRLIPENFQDMLDEDRNEVFLKLGSSDLHGTKHSEKNIEAVLKIYDDIGTQYKGCFEVITPDGSIKLDEYRSLITILNDRPQFDEMIKILLPEKPTKELHLKILYYHRRLQDKTQDKGPFALSYLKLFSHCILERSCSGDELLVYKVDKYSEKNISYTWLASTRSEQSKDMKNLADKNFSLNERNSVHFITSVISSYHTMDSKIHYILKYQDKNKDVVEKIAKIIKIKDPSAEFEIIKFFSQLMDTLFKLLGRDINTDQVVLEGISHLINTCIEHGYHSILEGYITTFYQINIYIPLTDAIIRFIDVIPRTDRESELLLKLIKSLGYITKLLVKSKKCKDFISYNPQDDTLKPCIIGIINKLKELIYDEYTGMMVKNQVIKYLSKMITPCVDSEWLEAIDIAVLVKDLLVKLPKEIRLLEKISFMNEIVNTDLFQDPDALNLLFDQFLSELVLLIDYDNGNIDRNSNTLIDEIILSSQSLADIIENLFPFSQLESVYRVGDDEQLGSIIVKSYNVVVTTLSKLLVENSVDSRSIVALLLALLDMCSAKIFDAYCKKFDEPMLTRIISEILLIFGKILEYPSFPQEWYQMKFIQDLLFLKHLRFINRIIISRINQNDNIIVQFFKASTLMLTKITVTQDTSIYSVKNKDVRELIAKTMRSMWHSLSINKKVLLQDKIIPEIVRVLLIDDYEIRATMVPIIVDMLMLDRNTDKRFIDEFIMNLDVHLDQRLGDINFKKQFIGLLKLRLVNYDFTLQEFVERIDRLIELLLNLRAVRNDSECLQSAKFCLVQLIEFYESIKLNELKIHYLDNLYRTHLFSGNDVEAAFILKDFSDMLGWTQDPIPQYIVNRKLHRNRTTQIALKELICTEMQQLFDKGEHWEMSIDVLKELIPVYEKILYDYDKLAECHYKMGELYKKINTSIRTESHYFLVGFYGKGFPDYLVNRKFVFRGEALEMHSQFKEKLMNNFFGAESVDHMDDNVGEYMNSNGKYLQIIPITPVQSDASLSNPAIKSLIQWYWRHHGVYEFEYFKPERRDNTKWTKIESNDATRLWIKKTLIVAEYKLPGALNFSPVQSEEKLEPLDPVQVAIQKIEEMNENMTETAELVYTGHKQYIVSLGGWIRGVLQADVGGGIKNYDSFFSPEIKSEMTSQELKEIERLKRIILRHVAVLEACLYVHAKAQNLVNQSLHAALVDLFYDYKKNIESKYGPAPSMLSADSSIHLPASGNLKFGEWTTSGINASSSSLNVDDVDNRQNVLLRAVPGAATILRSKSKISTPTRTMISGPDSSQNEHFVQTLRGISCRSMYPVDNADSTDNVDALNTQNDMVTSRDNDTTPTTPLSPPPIPPRLKHG